MHHQRQMRLGTLSHPWASLALPLLFWWTVILCVQTSSRLSIRNDAVIENFDSEVDNDLEEKMLKFKGRLCGVVYTIIIQVRNTSIAVDKHHSWPHQILYHFIIDEIRTSGRVAFPSIASEENIECDF